MVRISGCFPAVFVSSSFTNTNHYLLSPTGFLWQAKLLEPIRKLTKLNLKSQEMMVMESYRTSDLACVREIRLDRDMRASSNKRTGGCICIFEQQREEKRISYHKVGVTL